MADINVIVLPDGTEYPVSDYYFPVAISNPTDGQVLKYDATNQVWYNGEDASGSSVLYGTSAPTSQLGTDGCLYVKYTEGTGGASDTVDALYVKLDGSWCQISTGGGGGASSADQVSFDDTDVAFSADDAQEAFENITKSLTWSEYQQLTSEEKNNGTIYLITNVNGDGQNFQPVIYSEEEREIGVWKDGKPLYEKTIKFNNKSVTNSESTSELAHGISNIDTAFVYNAYADFNGTEKWATAMNNIVVGATVYNFEWAVGASVIYLKNTNLSFSASTDRTYLFVIRYTKTTDQPGSGTWTPQGVPAVHYSEDEHVVGTWIDGKALYEKTLTGTATISTQVTGIFYFKEFDISSMGIDKGFFVPEGSYYIDGTYECSFVYGSVSNTKLQVWSHYQRTNVPYVITIRYTKTS